MPKAIIKLTYRQIIDALSQTDFEKNILHFSYEEYKMKSQVYNVDEAITTFTALKAKDGRANSLHYKSGFAVVGFIDQLHNKIPFLHDAVGEPILFETYKFEVIETDVTNKLLHKVAIHYITNWITLYDTIGHNLLLATGIKINEDSTEPTDTFLVKMQPGLSISTYQELAKANFIELQSKITALPN